MKCTTGLSAYQLAELTQWISQSKPLHTIPAILGVAGSLQATLIYLRHNLPQAAIGELLGVSQPTVSRAVKALTELVTRALDGYLITAEEVAPGCDYVLDGTLMPCWSWKAHPEPWSGKHKRTGLNVQVLVTPAGRLVWVSDPCPGSTHDVAALDASGLLEGLDVSGWVADKGYIGWGMITPPRKPAGKKLSDIAKLPPQERTMCVESEFNSRTDGLNPLLATYGLPRDTPNGIPQANISLMDTGTIYTATDKGSCNFGEVFTTDGRIDALDLTVLEDDRHFFPSYNAAPIFNAKLLKRFPQLEGRFDMVAKELTETEMRKLNYQVDVKGRDPGDVVYEWMLKKKFITKK